MNTQPTLVRSSDFIKQQGRFWMPAQTLGEKIGYSHPQKAMSNIYNRNQEELEPFQGVLKMRTPGGEQEVRAFDEQGCYIVAMLAKTEEAKAFRMSLAEFLQKLRNHRAKAMQMRFKVAEMQEQYQELRAKNAHERLQRLIDRTDWTWDKLDRLNELHGVLTWPELGSLFGYSTGYLGKLWKQYREANGDFRDLTPNKLKEGRNVQPQ